MPLNPLSDAALTADDFQGKLEKAENAITIIIAERFSSQLREAGFTGNTSSLKEWVVYLKEGYINYRTKKIDRKELEELYEECRGNLPSSVVANKFIAFTEAIIDEVLRYYYISPYDPSQAPPWEKPHRGR